MPVGVGAANDLDLTPGRARAATVDSSAQEQGGHMTEQDGAQQGHLRLRAGAVSWREVDGEVIVLDLETSAYSGVNASGTVLWSLLAGGTTRAALEHALVDRFDVDRGRAAADVGAFLDTARAQRLIEG